MLQKMVRLYGSFIFFLYICSRKYTKINQTINQASNEKLEQTPKGMLSVYLGLWRV